jgi:hypothetical protein
MITQKTPNADRWNELKNLWNQFDPIGVFNINSDWPNDEYHSYILPVYILPIRNADFNEIRTYIDYIVKEHIGINDIKNEHIINFVHRLQNWYIQRKK